MSEIKNGGLDLYGVGPLEQQQLGISGVEGLNMVSQRLSARTKSVSTGEFSTSVLLDLVAVLRLCDFFVAVRRRAFDGFADTLPLAFRKAISSSAMSLSRRLRSSRLRCSSW